MRKLILVVTSILLSACATNSMIELEQKAIAGDSESQYLMGYSYERGQYNKANPSKAVEWYEKASQNNSPKAKHRLGLMYATGEGVQEDFGKTSQLFETAAKQKYAPAQLDYAMLLYGMAPPQYKDLVKAYAWFAVIKENDSVAYASIKDFNDKLESELSKAQLEKAKELGSEYVAKFSPKQAQPVGLPGRRFAP